MWQLKSIINETLLDCMYAREIRQLHFKDLKYKCMKNMANMIYKFLEMIDAVHFSLRSVIYLNFQA